MIRRSALALLFAAVMFSLSSCDPRSYVAIVNGKRVTDNDLYSLGRVLEILQPNNVQAEIAGLASVNAQYGDQLVANYVDSQAKQATLFGQSRIDSSDRALYKVTLLLQNDAAIPPSVISEFQKLPQHARVVYSHWLTAQLVFRAIDMGISPQQNSDVICANVYQFQDNETATAAVAALKSSGGVGAQSPIHLCVVKGQTYSDPVTRSLTSANTNDVVGPTSVVGGNLSQVSNTYYVSKVTDRSSMTFRDWPLEALEALQPLGPGKLTQYARSHLKVKLNPAFGNLPRNTQELSGCDPSSLVCIVAPDDPTRERLPDNQQQLIPQ